MVVAALPAAGRTEVDAQVIACPGTVEDADVRYVRVRPAATTAWKTATTHPNQFIVPVTVAYVATVATTAKAVTFAATTARRTERSSCRRSIQSNIASPRMTPPNCRTRSELSASSRPPKSEIAASGTTTNRRPKTVPLSAAAASRRR